MKNQKLLSLCIPTWNRSKFLKLSLERLYEQFEDEEVSKNVELIISDNCSTDRTKEVVDSYIKKDMPISYSCNEENVGADRNFVKCMQLATGKYIFLLGDDDILRPYALSFIINLLKNHDLGLVHFFFRDKDDSIKIYDNRDRFIKEISYFYTFMSGNIFRRNAIQQVDAEKYIGSYLLQMPFYIKSTLMAEENALVYKNIIEGGLDGESNGGYNFYQVFVQNYLTIWREFLKNEEIENQLYRYLKKDIYVKFTQKYNIRLLADERGLKKKSKDVGGQRGGFMIDGAWTMLFSNYGAEWYFFRSLLSFVYRFIRHSLGLPNHV